MEKIETHRFELYEDSFHYGYHHGCGCSVRNPHRDKHSYEEQAQRQSEDEKSYEKIYSL